MSLLAVWWWLRSPNYNNNNNFQNVNTDGNNNNIAEAFTKFKAILQVKGDTENE